MKIAAVQSDIAWTDPPANFKRFAERTAEAVSLGADLVVLPETFATGFGFGSHGFPVEPFEGPSAQFLSAQAQRHQVWVAGSCPELGDDPNDLPYNSFVFAEPSGALHRYRKVHPFSYGGEDRHVQVGTDLVSLTIKGVRVTPFVCYDLRFVTEFWAATMMTDLYLVTANWPAARRNHWRTLLTARAIENLAYVVGVNRIGAGGGLDYAGDSMIIGPDGTVLADAADTDTTLLADIDPSEVEAVRSRFGFLNDRCFGVDRTIVVGDD